MPRTFKIRDLEREGRELRLVNQELRNELERIKESAKRRLTEKSGTFLQISENEKWKSNNSAQSFLVLSVLAIFVLIFGILIGKQL